MQRALGPLFGLSSASQPLSWGAIRTATKKAGGSSRNGRDSNAKRLGVKLFGGEAAWPGCIIIRQRGTKYHIEKDGSVALGRDHTIFSMVEGRVAFRWDKVKRRRFVGVAKEGPVQVAPDAVISAGVTVTSNPSAAV